MNEQNETDALARSEASKNPKVLKDEKLDEILHGPREKLDFETAGHITSLESIALAALTQKSQFQKAEIDPAQKQLDGPNKEDS